jgi:uncharacterized protein YkwD
MSIAAKPRTTTHSRKRQGTHHRHNKGYVKTYWPYLPMMVIIAGGALTNTFLAGAQSVLGTQANYSSSLFLNITNKDRVAAHESKLSLNSELTSAAQSKAANMAKDNYWSHTSPSGKTAQDFIIDTGYQFSEAGENLAYGFSSAPSVMSAWMNSPEHKANILDAAYKDVGFGVAEAPNYLGNGPKVIVVAEYADPTNSLAAIGVVNQPPGASVTRLDSLTETNATWPEIALTALLTAAAGIVVLRHALGLRKFALESEEYLVKHPFIDIAIVALGTLAVVLSHTSGLIS